MKCNQCGSEFEGKFCTECGAKTPEQFQQPVTETAKPKKNKKPFYRRWWFVLLVIVAVIAVAISILNMGEKIVWNDIILNEMLPEPPADRGEIHTNSAEDLWIDIDDISDKQYADYVEACKAEGFTVEPDSSSSSFSAYNAEGYKLSLSHYSEELSINLDKPMELSTIKWPTSAAGKQLPAPESSTGKFSYEYDDNFFVYIGETSKTDYEEYVEACSEKGFDVDYDKGEKYYSADNDEGWHIRLCYEGNNIMSIDIDAPSEEDDNDNAISSEEETETEETETKETEEINEADNNGLDPDFKAAMDSYETFMNEYVYFMKKYSENPSDLELLADYADYVSKYSEFVADFEKWEDEEMNAAETAYYIDVQARVSKKLLELS